MAEKPTPEISYLPPSAPPTNHGHTVAAWFTMIGIIVGSVVAGLAVAFAMVWLFWVGMAIVLLSLVGGGVLRNMGYGQPKPGVAPRTSTQH
ncbi:HGxxPAAW family protein [Oerskovia turbata]